jgi:tight adherence protein B
MVPVIIAGLVFLAAVFFSIAIFVMVTAGTESTGRQIKQRLRDTAFGGFGTTGPISAEGEGARLIAQFESWLGRLPIGRHIGLLLEQANAPYLPGQFFLLTFFLGLLGFTGGFFLKGLLGGHFPIRDLLLGLVLSVILASLPYLILLNRKRERMKRFIEQFPDALEMMARSLRAGLGINTAMQMVAQEMPEPISIAFKNMVDEQNLGLSLQEAMKTLVNRVPILDVQFFVSAVTIQRETGGNLAEILDKIGYVIRERFKILGQVRVYTAQGRLTGYILTSLPIIVGILMYLIDPSYLMVLFQEKLGLYMLGAAAALQMVGFFIIRKIIKIQV